MSAITSLPKDPWLSVCENWSGAEVNAVRATCKTVKSFIDREPHCYSSLDFAAKRIQELSVMRQMEFTKIIQRLEEEKAEREAIVGNSCFSRILLVLNYPSLEAIKNIVCQIFPELVNVFVIDDINEQIFYFQIKLKNEIELLPYNRDSARLFAKMKDCFGGEEHYLKLPIIDLGENDLGRGYPSFPSSIISSPIMRGMDQFGREFFILRQSMEETSPFYVTYFQRDTFGGVPGWIDTKWSQSYNLQLISSQEKAFADLTDKIQKLQKAEALFLRRGN